MTENDILQQGEMAKYIVASNRQGLILENVDFEVKIEYGMMGKSFIIKKENMLPDVDGSYLMTFSTEGMFGKVKATLTIDVHDIDVSRGIRKETDSQTIAFVVDTPCPKCICMPCTPSSPIVTYTRTEQSNLVDRYVRLVDVYGRPLRTCDQEYIYVLRELLP